MDSVFQQFLIYSLRCMAGPLRGESRVDTDSHSSLKDGVVRTLYLVRILYLDWWGETTTHEKLRRGVLKTQFHSGLRTRPECPAGTDRDDLRGRGEGGEREKKDERRDSAVGVLWASEDLQRTGKWGDGNVEDDEPDVKGVNEWLWMRLRSDLREWGVCPNSRVRSRRDMGFGTSGPSVSLVGRPGPKEDPSPT